jgi:hypothetical protein
MERRPSLDVLWIASDNAIYRHLSTPSLPVYTPEQEEDGKPVAKMVAYEAVG